MHKLFGLFIAGLFVIAAGLTARGAGSSREIVDPTGQIARAPMEPKRVVSLAPSITEIIFALDRQDLLAGVTQFSDYPPAALKIDRVGSYVQLDLEKIISLKPDLCIATKDGNPKEIVERLMRLGIPVFVVNPRDFDSIIQTIDAIGGLLNAEASAARLTDDLERRIEKIRRKVAAAKVRPRVFLQIGISPIISAGANTFINEMILMAGAINLAAEDNEYPRFSREEVIQLAPDVLIITTMARKAAFQKVKDDWMKWRQMPAARNNRIHLVDANLFARPTPRMIEALEILANIIHPDLFN